MKNIKISQDCEMDTPAKWEGFPVEKRDWSRLKRMTSKLDSPSEWWSIGASSSLSFSVSSFLAYLAESEDGEKNLFMLIGIFLLIVSFLLFFISRKEVKRFSYSKEEIQNEMNVMEEPYISDR